MNHKRPPLPVILVILLVVAASVYFIVSQSLNDRDGALTASGAVEAVQVNIAPELSGKALEVLAEEGQSVAQDDALLILDPSLLAAQREVAAAQVDSARAALASAQTNYDLVVQAALASQQASQARDWRFSAPDEFNQPAWYFEQGEQLKSAQTEVEAAKVALETAQADLGKLVADLNNADLIAAEHRRRRFPPEGR